MSGLLNVTLAKCKLCICCSLLRRAKIAALIRFFDHIQTVDFLKSKSETAMLKQNLIVFFYSIVNLFVKIQQTIHFSFSSFGSFPFSLAALITAVKAAVIP